MEHLGPFILNHWILCLAILATMVLIYLQEHQAKKNQPQMLSPQMAVHWMNHENAVVIDLRNKEAFIKGHITDAIHASIDDFELPRFAPYKTKPLILVAGKDFQMDPFIKKLRQLEFKQPMILSGGIEGWQSASLPLVKKTSKIHVLPKKQPLQQK